MWRAKAGNPPPFLIHRNKQVIAAMQAAQFIRQRAQLLRIVAIAAKQNVASRVRLAKKGAFLRRQRQTRTSKDCGCHQAKLAAKTPSGKRGNHLSVRKQGERRAKEPKSD